MREPEKPAAPDGGPPPDWPWPCRAVALLASAALIALGIHAAVGRSIGLDRHGAHPLTGTAAVIAGIGCASLGVAFLFACLFPRAGLRWRPRRPGKRDDAPPYDGPRPK